MEDLVKVEIKTVDDKLLTNSKNVADVFGKQHKHILDSIRNIEKDVPNFRQMFFESTVEDSYGRKQPVFYMNRDGFTLLAMGFTGSDAMQWKLAYINAFNEMEKVFNSPEQIMARALRVADETIKSLEIKLSEQKPLVEYAERVSQSADTIGMSQMAKLACDEGVNIGRNRLVKFLKDNKILMSDNTPYQKFIDAGYFEVVKTEKKTVYGMMYFPKTVITGKGQIWLMNKLQKGNENEKKVK